MARMAGDVGLSNPEGESLLCVSEHVWGFWLAGSHAPMEYLARVHVDFSASLAKKKKGR